MKPHPTVAAIYTVHVKYVSINYRRVHAWSIASSGKASRTFKDHTSPTCSGACLVIDIIVNIIIIILLLYINNSEVNQ